MYSEQSKDDGDCEKEGQDCEKEKKISENKCLINDEVNRFVDIGGGGDKVANECNEKDGEKSVIGDDEEKINTSEYKEKGEQDRFKMEDVLNVKKQIKENENQFHVRKHVFHKDLDANDSEREYNSEYDYNEEHFLRFLARYFEEKQIRLNAVESDMQLEDISGNSENEFDDKKCKLVFKEEQCSEEEVSENVDTSHDCVEQTSTVVEEADLDVEETGNDVVETSHNVATSEDDVDTSEGPLDTSEDSLNTSEGSLYTSEGSRDTSEGSREPYDDDFLDTSGDSLVTSEGSLNTSEGPLDTSGDELDKSKGPLDTTDVSLDTSEDELNKSEDVYETKEDSDYTEDLVQATEYIYMHDDIQKSTPDINTSEDASGTYKDVFDIIEDFEDIEDLILATKSIYIHDEVQKPTPDKIVENVEMIKRKGVVPTWFKFSGDVPRLVRVMCEKYRNADVFLKELIVNSFAALKERERRDKRDGVEHEELEVTIIIDKPNRCLIIEDNGIGMTRNEVIDKLGMMQPWMENRINNLDCDYRSVSEYLGFGFFTSYMVAEHVLLQTKHQDDVQLVWNWHHPEFTFYTVNHDVRGQPLVQGTRVTLRLKSACHHLLTRSRVSKAVRKYLSLRTYPIAVMVDGSDVTAEEKRLKFYEKMQYVKYVHSCEDDEEDKELWTKLEMVLRARTRNNPARRIIV